jgi:hypothetical protein
VSGESSLTQGIFGGALPLMSITERGMGQTFGGQVNQMIGGQVSGNSIGSLILGKSVGAFFYHFPVVAGQCTMPRCIIRPRICWQSLGHSMISSLSNCIRSGVVSFTPGAPGVELGAAAAVGPEGKSGFAEPKRNEIARVSSQFRFVLGGSLFGERRGGDPRL